MSGFNLADLFEAVSDAVPDRVALVWGDRRLSFRQLEERSNQLAHGLDGLGVGQDDNVAILTYSRPEYVETMIACYKIRAVPVNVNYRYVADELAYLFADADVKVLVLEATFVPVVAGILEGLPQLTHLVVVADGTDPGALPASAGADLVGYEELLAESSPERDFGPRSPDDLYIAYTGGTTGMPKGVVWRQEDIYFTAMTPGVPVETPEDVVANAAAEVPARLAPLGELGVEVPDTYINYGLGPLMHVSGHWSAWGAILSGGRAVLHPDRQVDPHRVLEVVERERVTMLTVVGDALGRPIVETIEAEPGRYDTSSVLMLGAGGSVLSGDTKDRLLAGFPNAMTLVEAIGSSESPTQALAVTMRGQGPAPTLRFAMDERTTVFDEEFRHVEPGSGVVGRLATRGRIPLRYYKDEEKSARTFVTVDGERWALPGDMALIEADGTIKLLGRGSLCINTGGEKVYPEEVEAVLKAHPGIADAIVIGVPDPRFGERVAAVVAPLEPGGTLTLEEVQPHARQHLAGHKIPRQLFVVDHVVRMPSGKADYRWARQVAEGATAG